MVYLFILYTFIEIFIRVSLILVIKEGPLKEERARSSRNSSHQLRHNNDMTSSKLDKDIDKPLKDAYQRISSLNAIYTQRKTIDRSARRKCITWCKSYMDIFKLCIHCRIQVLYNMCFRSFCESFYAKNPWKRHGSEVESMHLMKWLGTFRFQGRLYIGRCNTQCIVNLLRKNICMCMY